jgi:hypothetical protein
MILIKCINVKDRPENIQWLVNSCLKRLVFVENACLSNETENAKVPLKNVGHTAISNNRKIL